jgi:hypothetical protein
MVKSIKEISFKGKNMVKVFILLNVDITTKDGIKMIKGTDMELKILKIASTLLDIKVSFMKIKEVEKEFT